jgi:hypothetical protein
VSILSYDGGVGFGIVTDRDVCREPQRIVDHIPAEFEALVYAVLMMPWDEDADRAAAARSLDATETLADAARHLSRGKARREGPPAGKLRSGPSRIRPTGVRAARASRR